MNLPVHPEFHVLDESAHWLVVDKPAPLIVHPANLQPEPTLLGGIEALLHYEIANGDRPAIVTRLDRDTSGIVLVAKTTSAARELGMIMERREAEKEYLAIVHGHPPVDPWESHEPILRAAEIGPSDIWVRQICHPDGRPCHTRFAIERRFSRDGRHFALVRCFPTTGRMHQIRVHLAAAGHPIVGDKIYSGDGSEYLEWMQHGWTLELATRLLIPRHALHATRLNIPWNGKPVLWQSPLPADLMAFVEGRDAETDPGIILWNRNPHSS
ncbi:MAG: RluA family pseudouridine synthase [Luteolibacter sp.]|jgi:23S rRNA pseudouridine1911/1915/1917 synthase